MKRILSLVLSFMMVLMLLPFDALALELETAEASPEISAEEQLEVLPAEEKAAEPMGSAELPLSGYCGGEGDGTNLRWELSSEGVLTISGTGAMADYDKDSFEGLEGYYSTAPWGIYIEEITDIVVENGVTYIGESAFESDSLYNIAETVNIPESVKTLGVASFSGLNCEFVFEGKLEKVEINAFRAFNYAKIYFMNGAPESIDEDSFYGNVFFYYLAGTEDLWEFDENGLWNGYEVKPYTPGEEAEYDPENYLYSGYCGGDSTVDGKNLAWGYDREGNLHIMGKGPMADYEEVERNGNWYSSAPWWNLITDVKDIIIDENVTHIGSYAFHSNSQSFIPERVEIPAGIKTIGNFAFMGRRGTFVIEGRPEEIGIRAFNSWQKYTVIFMAGAPAEVKNYAFGGEANLYYLLGTEDLWEFDKNGLWNGYELMPYLEDSGYCGAEGDGTNLSWSIGQDRILRIKGKGAMADYGQKKEGDFYINTAPWGKYISYIEGIRIEEGVTDIGAYAFHSYYGSVLKHDVIIPESVKVIKSYAFDGLSGKFIIESRLEKIGNWAFYGWLEDGFSVYFNAGAPITAEAEPFGDKDSYFSDIYYLVGTEDLWEFDENGLWNGYKVELYDPYPPKEGYCGGEGDGTNLYWKLDDEGTLTITGTGRMRDFSSSNPAPWLVYNFRIKKLVLGEGITSIGDSAFYICTGIKGNLVIPKSVESIGRSAFYSCYGFSGNLVIPDNVKFIGSCAFYNCKGLKGSLSVGNGVSEIGALAFASCGFEGTLTLGNKIKTIGRSAFAYSGFSGNLVIPDSVTVIKYDAFSFCDFGGTLTLGKNLESIGGGAFYNTEFTGNLVIPDSVTQIRRRAFEQCSGFDGELVIGSGVKNIEDYAFVSGNYTGKLIIPDSVEVIGCHTFRMCNDFAASAEIGTGIKEIFPYAFRWCGADAYRFEGNAPKVTEAAIQYHSFDLDDTIVYPVDNSSWKIKNEKWNGYSTLMYDPKNPEEKVVGYCGGEADGKNLMWKLSNEGVLTISGKGSMADYISDENLGLTFEWSEYLDELLSDISFGQRGPWKGFEDEIKEIVIEEGVTDIGDFAFASLASLEKVTIANTVTEIGKGAFLSCGNLTEANVFGAARTIGKGAFALTSLAGEMKVPAGAVIEEMAFAFSSLTKVDIAANADADMHAFLMCSELESINVASGNSTLYSIEGVLFNKSVTTLVQYPAKKAGDEYTVPEGVEIIGPAAFGKAGLENIILAKSTEKIDEFAFVYSEIENITIPENVTRIENYAFLLSKLTDITFEGNAPSVAGIDNDAPSLPHDVVVHYNPEKSGWNIYDGKWKGYTVKEAELPADATVSVDSASMVIGSSKHIKVSITEGSDAALIQFAVRYDPTVLKVVSCNAGSAVSDATINTGEAGIIYFVWESLSGINMKETLLDIEFTTAENAQLQETSVEIVTEGEEFFFADSNLGRLRVDTANGTIKVIDVIYGDVNGDGKVNVLDANLIRRYSAKLIGFDDGQFTAAEVSGDGKVNVLDANFVRRFSAKIIDKFPVEQ
ncbi:MAG: leucine-rich repeat protein [Oscillospiraceae bacterium]|nr:leucine-rich repeat protein [Oscillospiraceae bacterium]